MSKKKSVPLVWSLCLVLMVSTAVFVSCPEPSFSNFGSLTVSTSAIQSKTISPGPTEITVASYSVTGTGPGDTTFTPVTASSSPITVPDLIAGTWSITVEGRNAEGVVIADDTQEVVIQARQTTDAYFNLVSLSGEGDFSLTITWPESVTSVAKITASLNPEVEGKSVFTVLASEATTSEGLHSITRTISGLPTGSYALTVNFLDASDDTVAFPMMEQVNIYKAMASNGTFALPEFWFLMKAPTISPNGGRIDREQTIALSTTTDGATIYYTLDGSDPDTSDTAFAIPFTLPSNTTVKAIAVRSDMVASKVASAYFEVPAASPTFSLTEGTYEEPQYVTLTSATGGASFFYTTDGSTPTVDSTAYTGSIAINENTVLKAIATHHDYGPSDPSSIEYKIKTAVPTFSPREGSYSNAQTVVLSSATSGATIHFTLDGSTPTSSSMVYTTPLELSSTTTVKAIAEKNNMELSAVVSGIYTILLYEPVASPTCTPGQGIYSEMQQVVLSSTTEGASIYFTIDGTEPTKASALYASPITVSTNTTLKAYAVKEGAADSLTVSADYAIQAAVPTFSVTAGTYTESKELSLSTTTEGASIWYTLDGSIPTTESTRYTGVITLNDSTTVKAIATKSGMANSNVAEASYVILGLTGLTVTNPALYEVEIVVPSEWTGEPLITNIVAVVVANVSPSPSGVVYTWYLDGVEARNRKGEIASTTNILKFGMASSNVAVGSGPHVLTVKVDAVSRTFSDYYCFRAYDTGTIGVIGYLPEIGEQGPAGGLVFFDKGFYSDGWRYLEAAPSDILIGASDYSHIFGYYRTSPTGSNRSVGTSTAIGTGKANTAALVAAMGNMAYTFNEISVTTTTADYAARLCDTFVSGGYDDWFLPSKDELDLMYDNLKVYGLGGFSDYYGYWSSSEFDTDYAWGQFFSNGFQDPNDEGSETRVRPVRAF